MKGLMAWHDGGMSSPSPQLLIENITYPEQPEIWKLIASSAPMTYWKGNFFRFKYSWSDYVFDYNTSFQMQACISLPYFLALGTFSFNFTLKSVDCLISNYTPVLIILFL
jgi:hypothetical protein